MEARGTKFSEGTGKTMVSLKGVPEDAGFEALPKGTYNCEIDEVEAKFSNNGGNPMWAVKLKVVDGEYAGRVLYTHIVFTEKMAGRNVKTFKRLGVEHLLELEEFDFEDDNLYTQLLDKACRARVTTGKYEGRTTNSVKELLPPEGAEDAFLPGDDSED